MSVQNGDLADARTLAPRMEALMTALHTLPKESAREHLPALEAVCAGLDGLVASYRNLAESSRVGLQQLPTLMRASSAYARQGAVAGTVRDD